MSKNIVLYMYAFVKREDGHVVDACRRP